MSETCNEEKPEPLIPEYPEEEAINERDPNYKRWNIGNTLPSRATGPTNEDTYGKSTGES